MEIVLIVYGKDRTRRVLKPSAAVSMDKEGSRLSPGDIRAKMATIAETVEGRNYLSHEYRILSRF